MISRVEVLYRFNRLISSPQNDKAFDPLNALNRWYKIEKDEAKSLFEVLHDYVYKKTFHGAQ